MADTLRGFAEEIISENTFKMVAPLRGRENIFDYSYREKIKISEIELSTDNKVILLNSKEQLENTISGREIKCFVQSRDNFGRVVAKVKVLS